jgi:simple sugar transport system ATP-binding protein
MIAVSHLSKSFAGMPALKDVSLAFADGGVHGLLGENGAGKSTLMNILYGLEHADAGTVVVDGAAVRIASPRAAQKLGIGMVHQHFKLVPGFSVLDNIALALSPGLGRIDRGALKARVAAQAEALHWRIAADAPIAALGVGEQQRVEILKALMASAAAAGASRTLILDEPTAVLTPQEVDDLLPALRALAAGGATVILISHKLQEVERSCDTVSVLRRGRVVHSGPAGALSRDELARRLLGAAPPLSTRQPPRPAPGGAELRLAVSGLALTLPGGGAALNGVALEVRAGEIVAIAGIDGNGQEALGQAIIGGTRAHAGSITVVRGRSRMGVIPGDRQTQAMVMPMSVTENLMLRDYHRPPFARAGWLRPAAWAQRAGALIARFDVRARALDQGVEALSGGNQQKLVVARELAGDPDLVVAINPTRGLDIGATAFVLGQLTAARERGAGVLLIHSDLDELLAVADRVLVACAGQLLPSSWPVGGREAIGRLMVGLAEGA